MGLVASLAAGKHGATGRDGAFMGLGVEKPGGANRAVFRRQEQVMTIS
jgi:isopropylmalate/homocitrate/citramalate synthase